MKIREIADFLGAKASGEVEKEIFRVASLDAAQEGDIAFVENANRLTSETKASCLIVPEGLELPFNRTTIAVKNPKLAFAKVATLLIKPHRPSGLSQTAVISNSAVVYADFIGEFVVVGENSQIGKGSLIYDGVKVGRNVKIGENCKIFPNCVIYDNVTIGNNCIIHAGAVIGADGFGFVRDENGYVKFPQIGTVVIEDDVEIGANTCVDRGALGETRIGQGTKIDNLVQVGHNVRIGRHVVIAAETGISGSVVIEDNCVIGGQVGIGDHATIKSGAVIGSQAGILPGKIVRAGVWWGTPVQPLNEYKRQNAHVKGLERFKEEVKQLKSLIEEIQNSLQQK